MRAQRSSNPSIRYRLQPMHQGLPAVRRIIVPRSQRDFRALHKRNCIKSSSGVYVFRVHDADGKAVTTSFAWQQSVIWPQSSTHSAWNKLHHFAGYARRTQNRCALLVRCAGRSTAHLL